MIDVANAAAVSKTTVSYVLNRRPVAVPEDTKQRILNAAEQLGYQPNRMARNLAQQRSGLIGVLTPINTSPFHAQLTGELSSRASCLDYTLLFEPIRSRLDQHGYRFAVNKLTQWRVDGLLIWCDEFAPELLVDYPTVFMGTLRSFPPEQLHVGVDLYAGATSAAKHLVGLGHRKICYVGRNNADLDPRWQALADVAAIAGIPVPMRLEEAEAQGFGGKFARVMEDCQDSPTAFFCISDVQALNVFRRLLDAGLKVPRDVSLISCDESWVAESLDPPLSAVSVPFAEMADSALTMLFELIAKKQPDFPQRVLVPQLRVRGSTSAPAIREVLQR